MANSSLISWATRRRVQTSPKKAVGFGPLVQQSSTSARVGRRSRRWATGSRLIGQGSGTVAVGARQPLTNRRLADPQSRSDADLGPALLIQFPGAAAATFAPTEGSGGIGCAHKPRQSTSRPTIIRYLSSYQ